MHETADSIPVAAAKQGFAQICVVWQARLAKSMGVPWNTKDPSLARIERLVQACLPNASDDDIVAYLGNRVAKDEPPSLLQDPKAREELEGIMDGEERAECKAQLKEVAKKAQGRKTFETYLTSTGKRVPSASKAGAIGTMLADIKLVNKEVLAEVMSQRAEHKARGGAPPASNKDHLPANFRDFLPAGVIGCTLQAVPTRQQFLARYPRKVPPRSRTITYVVDAASGGLSRDEAYRQAIRWLWMAHEEAQPGARMPFRLEDARL